MKITFLGTTTLLFDDGNDQILFDAHLTRPSLIKYLLNKEVSTDTKIADEIITSHEIDRLKAIFISHSHFDHVMDVAYIANKCNATVYGSSSVEKVALGGNVPPKRINVFKGNELFEVGDYKIKVIPSIHSKPTALNNDLGQTIDAPLSQPAKLRDYKEGGSYDFYIENKEKSILIRPSFNYIEGQLDEIKADVLFLGVAGLANADEETERIFFRETIEKVKPELVIPVHWDNFFSGLNKPVKRMPRFVEKTEEVFYKLAKYCEKSGVSCLVQLPGTNVEI